MRLVVYLRTSVVGPGNGESFDAQEEACRAWAERERHEVVAVHRDRGLSGKLGPRYGLQRHEVEQPLPMRLVAIHSIRDADQSRVGIFEPLPR